MSLPYLPIDYMISSSISHSNRSGLLLPLSIHGQKTKKKKYFVYVISVNCVQSIFFSILRFYRFGLSGIRFSLVSIDRQTHFNIFSFIYSYSIFHRRRGNGALIRKLSSEKCEQFSSNKNGSFFNIYTIWIFVYSINIINNMVLIWLFYICIFSLCVYMCFFSGSVERNGWRKAISNFYFFAVQYSIRVFLRTRRRIYNFLLRFVRRFPCNSPTSNTAVQCLCVRSQCFYCDVVSGV